MRHLLGCQAAISLVRPEVYLIEWVQIPPFARSTPNPLISQTTLELRPRLNVLTFTLAVPKCTFSHRSGLTFWDWCQRDFCVVAICAFNLVRLSTQIIQAAFPQESSCSVFHAAINHFCISSMKYEEWKLHHANILKEMDHVECQNCIQVSAGSTCRPWRSHWKNMCPNTSRCVCDVSFYLFFTPGKKGESIQVWVVTLMTRSPLTFKLLLTVNFRGTDVSAGAQADTGFSARRLSNHLENTGNTRCFHFLLTF